MAPLVLFGYLLCNVLLAWATLHKPFLSTPRQTLSSPPPQNKNEWVHSVIFEPQPKIQLTLLSYKVTSLFDFQPFLKGIFKELYLHSKHFRLHHCQMNQPY